MALDIRAQDIQKVDGVLEAVTPFCIPASEPAALAHDGVRLPSSLHRAHHSAESEIIFGPVFVFSTAHGEVLW